MTRKNVKRWIIVVALSLGRLAAPAWACDVPVYLWALQQWEPDSYSVYVFHDGQLTPEQHTVLEHLKNAGNRGNLTLRDADVSSALDAQTRAIWEEQTDAVLPWMVLRHPASWPSTTTLWAGPLDQAEVDAIIDSPKRQELLRDLLKGDAVVWILVDGDDASERVLQEAFSDVERNPPESQPTPGATGGGQNYPLPRFPMVRLNRHDPAESVFVEMLLHVEPDLKGYTEPMAFPVFGRGRALYALVGAGINPQTVRKACSFLVGACSCLVKEQNPGMDLLLAADWKGRPEADVTVQHTDLPPLPGLPRQPEAPVQTTIASSVVVRNLISALALGALIVSGVSWVLWRRRNGVFHG